MTHHVAQLNIARMQAPLSDPIMAGFVAQIDRINAAAEASEGFVWRLEMPDPEAISMRAFGDPTMLVNMSVWSSLDALRRYVYHGAHAGPLRDRTRWFLPMDGPSSVLWWVPAGHRPDLAQGKTRLVHLAQRGPSATAFTFTHPYPSPSPRERTNFDPENHGAPAHRDPATDPTAH
jgi:hypothetical protein